MGGVTCRHCCSGACCKHNKHFSAPRTPVMRRCQSSSNRNLLMTTRSAWLGVYAGLQSVPLMTSRHRPPLQAPRRAHVESAGPHEEPRRRHGRTAVSRRGFPGGYHLRREGIGLKRYSMRVRAIKDLMQLGEPAFCSLSTVARRQALAPACAVQRPSGEGALLSAYPGSLSATISRTPHH